LFLQNVQLGQGAAVPKQQALASQQQNSRSRRGAARQQQQPPGRRVNRPPLFLWPSSLF
jgi:hypothetical protein